MERIGIEGTGFPEGLAQPALRALRNAGITRLEQLTTLTEVEFKGLHGVGPKAVTLLRQALEAKGLSFK
ncbi:hypothetical protein H8B09_03835 [Paenibacillus sp. PR3]|uniref:DNA-binding protein n=1 Tax=Paenibacillus terricola TaxID=2763503 RepID=A0ABR8MSI8_9BACL|nr:hypothetical protein [Paenibacillus terricola]MBD3917872.1 hypothetical protein [Paenibacillus terricola]